jgi:hypothetical protein
MMAAVTAETEWCMYTVVETDSLTTGVVWQVVDPQGNSLVWFWHLDDALKQAAEYQDRAPRLRANGRAAAKYLKARRTPR